MVVEGLPDIHGATMLERRRFAEAHFDDLRRSLMWEPRGHADMYGAFVGPPVDPSSDLSVLFIHNDGFSTMCGHGIIALTKVVLDTGMLPAEAPETVIRIDTPAGQIEATAQIPAGVVQSVSFRNVPSFVAALDQDRRCPRAGDGSVRPGLRGRLLRLCGGRRPRAFDRSVEHTPAHRGGTSHQAGGRSTQGRSSTLWSPASAFSMA